MRECPQCEICYGDEVQFCPQDQSQTRHTLPGTQLLAGRYFIERRLGRGAMGQVYLARDENLGTRRVAVKTVRQDLLNSDDLQEGEAIVRFEREARSAASISHPHVVDVTDFGKTENGVFYLVMEYVEGETLHRLLRREGTLTVKRAVNLLKQIAEGVEAAHEAGILHRDLKPANIFIMQKRTGKSEDGFIKVGDFGLAKIVNQTVTDTSSDATPSSRGIIGTPEFMSPEQMQPEIGVDVRADVYALGTIAYLMLGGRTPFAGDLMQLVMQKIMHTPPPLSSLRSDIPAAVERAVMMALEREAARRPPTVADWISELEKAAEDVSERKSAGGKSRVVILAPVGSEVYVDDERHGTIGSTGRLILTGIPAGQHVLRVSKAGEKDDDRVIEIREDGNEQVIQAQLKRLQQGSQPSPSQGSGSVGEQSSILPGIVACLRCGSRYAEGVKFCGRCGNSSFTMVSPPEAAAQSFPCPRCSTKLPPFSKFCGACGLKIGQNPSAYASAQPISFVSNYPSGIPKPVEKICQRCGGAFPPNIKFCGRCGANL
ncbi:MAG: protein kinase [Acidobacteriota bacterium]|nr:protein kinase [Acidobacteriota bacterium]